MLTNVNVFGVEANLKDTDVGKTGVFVKGALDVQCASGAHLIQIGHLSVQHIQK